ncbi:MAG: hypothetical protein HZB39_02020, partial [Planctomycetes bacterium]|nr:hypothetical protein [Planctomycetota bacterium]
MVRTPRSSVLLAAVALAAAVPAQTRLLRFDGLPNGPTVNKVPCAGLGDLDGVRDAPVRERERRAQRRHAQP